MGIITFLLLILFLSDCEGRESEVSHQNSQVQSPGSFYCPGSSRGDTRVSACQGIRKRCSCPISHCSSAVFLPPLCPFYHFCSGSPLYSEELALEKAPLSQARIFHQAPSYVPRPSWATSYRMFSAASQPLDPDGTVFRLRFTAMVWWVITFPAFGFFFCIIWSLVFHFEYTVATDCGVSARLLSTWVRARVRDSGKAEIRE